MHVDAAAANEAATPVETVFCFLSSVSWQPFCLASLLLHTLDPPGVESAAVCPASGNAIAAHGQICQKCSIAPSALQKLATEKDQHQAYVHENPWTSETDANCSPPLSSCSVVLNQ